MRRPSFPDTVSPGRLCSGLLLTLAFLLTATAPAGASWLIDPETYHVSAHGQVTCLDCHADVVRLERHPDPRQVNRKPDKPERLAVCLDCHGHVADDLEAGQHGSEAVDDPDDYQNCLDCHDPHYQTAPGFNAQQPGPSAPSDQRCSGCHEWRGTLPPPAAFDGAGGRCMECHQTPDLEKPTEHARVQALCFHCHAGSDPPAGDAVTDTGFRMDREAYRLTPHASLACLACHPQAARYGHSPQKTEACLSCHTRHDEKKAHDAHLLVSCEACHLPGIVPARQAESGRIIAHRQKRPGQPTTVHDFTTRKDLDACRSCHFAANPVGAAAMILPPKSILCMPCHAATFSAGDAVTILSLLFFGAGMLLIFSHVLSGSLPGKGPSGVFGKIGGTLAQVAGAVFSIRILIILQTIFWDVLLQRRLYRQSRLRWMVHSLIFMPFLIRFAWGMTALLASLWHPQWAATWALLDKNHPITALVFDLTGAMILVGLIWAVVRDRRQRRSQPADLPRQDRLALFLIGLLVVVGFVLEGARIAMTGHPPGSEWAVVGYALSGLFGTSPTLTSLYGYLWYLHAILSGAFVAYLPFSRLVHIILAPITLSIRAVSDHEHKTNTPG